jgi:hypothetical protein
LTMSPISRLPAVVLGVTGMVPFRACSEALRFNSAAALARRVSFAEGEEVLLILPIAGRCKPLVELTERSCCLGVVLLLWSAICYPTARSLAYWLQGQSQ